MALFHMLGPLVAEPRAPGDRLTVPRGPKVRKLLCLFLLHPGTIMTLNQIMDELWGRRRSTAPSPRCGHTCTTCAACSPSAARAAHTAR